MRQRERDRWHVRAREIERSLRNAKEIAWAFGLRAYWCATKKDDAAATNMLSLVEPMRRELRLATHALDAAETVLKKFPQNKNCKRSEQCKK